MPASPDGPWNAKVSPAVAAGADFVTDRVPSCAWRKVQVTSSPGATVTSTCPAGSVTTAPAFPVQPMETSRQPAGVAAVNR